MLSRLFKPVARVEEEEQDSIIEDEDEEKSMHDPTLHDDRSI
jgi:hypothetical protein